MPAQSPHPLAAVVPPINPANAKKSAMPRSFI
jgi:hypothetical protein